MAREGTGASEGLERFIDVIYIILCRFAANRTQCVLPMSKLIFVCPNTATIVTRLNDTSGLDPHYENLWLVSRRNYERCEVNKSSDRKLIPCDMPFTLKYYTAIFKRYSASNDPVFKPGQDYYFIGKNSLPWINSRRVTSPPAVRPYPGYVRRGRHYKLL